MNTCKLKAMTKHIPNVHVCAIDKLKCAITNTINQYFIVNTLPSFIKDTGHWILVYKYKGQLFMYDSLNLNYRLDDYLNIVILKTNNTRHQSLYSNLCSYYVIYVLIKLHNGNNISDIMKNFYKDSVYNDKMVAKCIFDWFDE